VKSVRLSTDSMVEEFARLRPVTCFFGSDHCALFLTLHPHDASDAKEHAKEHAKDVICISD